MVAVRANVAPMRDTLRLRQRLVVLACLPALGAGCDDAPPKPEKHARTEAKAKADPPAKGAEKGTHTAAKRSGPRINEGPKPPPLPTDPDELRMMPHEGDPPFIDGYNPEEEPCPSGNWCGTVDTALAIAPNPSAVPKEMDCPTRIVGSHKDKKVEGPRYAGLSSKNNMQGALNQHGTELKRADGKDNACCYHWFEYCSGRPLLDEGEALTASAVDRSEWVDGIAVSERPAAEVREALVDAWLADAAAEHASIAAFSRVVLELMAVGAPADLLAATVAASQDEVRHAKGCYAVASTLAERELGPGPLAVVAPREATLARVAVDALVEGCIGETIAALVAERAGNAASAPAVRELLAMTAEDESRHAAVAWRTLAWALREGGADVAAAVRTAADEAFAVEPRAVATPDHPDWKRFGRLSAEEHRQAVLDARHEIIGPMLRDLLA